MTFVLIVSLATGAVATLGAAWGISRRYLADLGSQCRLIGWEELEPRLRAGDGTVIVNYTNAPGDVWWTEKQIDRADVLAALVSYARLVALPREFRDTADLRRAYPAVRYLHAHGSIRT